MPEHFSLHDVAAGVYAAVAGASGAAVGNAAIIDVGDKTIVFDAFMTAQAAAELRDEVGRVTGRGAFLLVNSHWHGDHTWGNQVFADTPIVSTARTMELIVADAPTDLAAYEAELEGHLEHFRTMLGDDDPDKRALAERRIAGLDQLKAAAPGFRLTLPDIHFEDRLVIEGERRVELLTYGPGHTDSDVFAWLPDTSTVVSGDLCWNRIHPRSQDGHPAAWADSLEKMQLLSPGAVVPGHGKPGGNEMIDSLIPYFRAIADYVAEARDGGDPESMPPPAGSERWDGPDRMRTGIQIIASR